jgi:hypothetical protein
MHCLAHSSVPVVLRPVIEIASTLDRPDDPLVLVSVFVCTSLAALSVLLLCGARQQPAQAGAQATSNASNPSAAIGARCERRLILHEAALVMALAFLTTALTATGIIMARLGEGQLFGVAGLIAMAACPLGTTLIACIGVPQAERTTEEAQDLAEQASLRWRLPQTSQPAQPVRRAA